MTESNARALLQAQNGKTHAAPVVAEIANHPDIYTEEERCAAAYEAGRLAVLEQIGKVVKPPFDEKGDYVGEDMKSMTIDGWGTIVSHSYSGTNVAVIRDKGVFDAAELLAYLDAQEQQCQP